MHMISNHECTFPTNENSSVTHYIANITESDFLTTEKTVFKNLTEKARNITRQADEQLKQILRVRGMDASKYLYIRNRTADLEQAVKNRMAIEIGSYLYFPGGHWVPLNCKAKWKVSLIIPYRNRSYNLNILLRNLIPFLQSQELEFGIFIAEQGSSEVMNRGLMKNIGYQMAKLSGTIWDCYVFHDVDYVPINSTNYYGCDDYPKHYATKLEEFKYDNPYMKDFGGVVGLTGLQMDKINGYSNMYWGWGGEDTDLYKRVTFSKFKVTKATDGYYRDLPHQKKTEREECKQRLPFVQLLLVHAYYEIGASIKQVALAYILMSNKRKRAYREAIQELRDALPGPAAVEEIMVDFEAALWKVLPRIFPQVITKIHHRRGDKNPSAEDHDSAIPPYQRSGANIPTASTAEKCATTR
ncbi:beta-1,4-galactosyltransferase 5 [Strongylocentrotus purpuratus]|uniref:Beta-1,4-galactosyltransferase n=1 Tax=Strongylocentrotus purpuratus TaxID=7668 RepID=A0A7M7N434_STRPU|nr:beta-1,4-galactosyltransferase 5 [Strongylocentrotus purpuratus]